MYHAHAILEIKSADPKARKFSGVATTPTPDRTGDIVEPLGATFTNPIPLLWHHDQRMPIGLVRLHAPTAAGITFDAEIPIVSDPGPLRDRTDDAWQCLVNGVIRGVSVGSRALEGGIQYLKTGGRRLMRSEICELSLVTVPANAEATIDVIKSLDSRYLAAPGPNPTAVVVARLKERPMNAQEQVTQFENSRAAKVARLQSIMGSATDATLPPDLRTEYDDISLEVKAIDEHLTRARDLERLMSAQARPVNGSPAIVSSPSPVVSVKATAEPGITWTRAMKSLLQAKGDSYRAMEYAKAYRDPNVDLIIKAAVAPGTTTDPAWAGALVTVSNLTNEFIALARAATILGKVPGLRKVPFNTSIPIVTGGGTYKWVGQGKAKPVGKMTFGSTSLGMAKAAGIIVLTEELVRSSEPSAETIVRDEMIRGMAAYLDQQFTDPTVAAVADVSPASITNGAPTAASSDDPGSDLGMIMAHFSTAQLPLSGLTIIMSEVNAAAMGMTKNALGTSEFPSVGISGGTANGVTIVASNTVGDKVIALAPNYVLYADDGQVTIDVSREATLQMNDAPVSPADPATTVWTSLFQDNLVALRAERYINWKRAVTPAVYYLTGAAYPFTPVVNP